MAWARRVRDQGAVGIGCLTFAQAKAQSHVPSLRSYVHCESKNALSRCVFMSHPITSGRKPEIFLVFHGEHSRSKLRSNRPAMRSTCGEYKFASSKAPSIPDRPRVGTPRNTAISPKMRRTWCATFILNLAAHWATFRFHHSIPGFQVLLTLIRRSPPQTPFLYSYIPTPTQAQSPISTSHQAVYSKIDTHSA